MCVAKLAILIHIFITISIHFIMHNSVVYHVLITNMSSLLQSSTGWDDAFLKTAQNGCGSMERGVGVQNRGRGRAFVKQQGMCSNSIVDIFFIIKNMFPFLVYLIK